MNILQVANYKFNTSFVGSKPFKSQKSGFDVSEEQTSQSLEDYGALRANFAGSLAFRGQHLSNKSFLEDMTDDEFEKMKAEVLTKMGEHITNKPEKLSKKIGFNKYNVQLANCILDNYESCGSSDMKKSFVRIVKSADTSEKASVKIRMMHKLKTIKALDCGGVKDSLPSLIMQTDTPEEYEARMQVITKLKDLDFLKCYDEGRELSKDLLRHTKTSENAGVQCRMLSKFNSLRLRNYDNVKDMILNVVFGTETIEQANAKCEVMDLINKNGIFNSAVIKLAIRSIRMTKEQKDVDTYRKQALKFPQFRE